MTPYGGIRRVPASGKIRRLNSRVRLRNLECVRGVDAVVATVIFEILFGSAWQQSEDSLDLAEHLVGNRVVS